MITSIYTNKQNAIARFATASIASLLVSGAMILTTGCSDDSSSPAGASASPSRVDDGDAMVFEMGDGTYELNVTGNGAWRIVDSTFFVQSISQTEGNGPATVKLKVLNNDLDERLEGKLIIEYDDPAQNQTINCVQKYYGDYDENAPTQTNKKYGVGFAYNAITGGFADKGVTVEVFNTAQLYDDGAISGSGTSINYSERSITGSTIADISYQLAIKNNVKGKIGKFEAEMKNSYDVGVAAQDTFQFAMNYIDLVTQSVSLDIPLDEIIYDDSFTYIKKTAYNAINGIGNRYPSSNEGFKRLIKAYGTHVVTGSNLGARIRQSMKANVAHISTKFDMKTFAKGAYTGKVANTSNTVEHELHASLQANLENMDINVSVWGGDAKKAMALTNSKILNPEDVREWKESIVDTTGNMYLLGFSEDGLIPLYELVDEDLPGGKERKQKLKDYMEGKDVISDFSTYECGTVTVVNVPKIEDFGDNTLVKDIYIKGQLIAKAVLEYIPNQNYNEKITVIYPVINNKVRFNMGFFIGDENHKPARVTWDGTDVAIVEYPELDFGKAKTLYIRGASITSEMPHGTTPFTGRVEDSYLKAKKYQMTTNNNKIVKEEDVSYNYPLVKVFNHIWTREDYLTRNDKYGLSLGYHKYSDAKNDRTKHFTVSSLGANETRYNIQLTNYISETEYAPAGWSIPDTTAFKEIANKLEANGLTKISNAMFNKKICLAAGETTDCGLLGLNLNGSTAYPIGGAYATNSTSAAVGVDIHGSTIRILKPEINKRGIISTNVRLIQN